MTSRQPPSPVRDGRAPDADGAGRSERALWISVAAGVTIVLAAAAMRVQANPILAAFVVPLALIAYQRMLLAWQTLLGLILLVILFIPIRRYTVGGGLPFELEPYRFSSPSCSGAGCCALAADPRCAGAQTGLEAPIGALLVAILGSLAVNLPRGERPSARSSSSRSRSS